MTSPNTAAKNPHPRGKFRLPDPPEREPDEKMTTAIHLHEPGNTHHLAQHFGNPETTLVTCERYITMRPQRMVSGSLRRVPDLMIAFGVDSALYRASNGYVISEQGKPPDFVLEVASRSTGREDTGPKRRDYEALGIPEYWRFDETGEFHRTRLAGDRLVDGEYQPIAIEEPADGALQGYSEVLNLHIRWERGQLRWHDPATGRHIATFEYERASRIQAEARAANAEARADNAEARARELEEELERLRGA